MKHRAPLKAILALSLLTPIRAQLVMDAGGPRDVFYDNSAQSFLGLEGWEAKLDTSDKAVKLGYYWEGDFLGFEVVGFNLKGSAVDGLEQFFRFESWPKADLSMVANRTFTTPWISSITFRLTGSYGDYALFDPSGSRRSTKGFVGGEAAVTYSFLLPRGEDGFALTAGVRETSNYQDLPKTTIGDLRTSFPGDDGATTGVVSGSSVLRYGSFDAYREFPVTLLYAHVFDSVRLSDFIKDWGWFFVDKKAEVTYGLVPGLYGSFVPREEHKPYHTVGFNLVLRKFVSSDDANNPQKDVLSFPYSVFVQRRNTFHGKPDTKVGAAIMFKF